ncbi:MAG: phytoene desaturase [Sphingobacteriales bacterium]|jgi:phytoene desaturase
MPNKIAIVGAGIAGIATAIRLQQKGYQCSIFESNATPGGKFTELNKDGFRFDMGPTIFTLPELIDELFELCGKNPRDFVTFNKLENTFKFWFDDGTSINAFADLKKFAKELKEKTDDSPENLTAYLEDAKRKYDLTREVFIENSLHKVSNYLRLNTFMSALQFGKVGAFKTMDEHTRQYFKNEKTIQLFNNYITYVGSNPFIAPSTLSMIAHLALSNGAYLPNGGMYTIVKQLVSLAEDIGVNFHYNSKVNSIEVESKKVKGIVVNSEFKAFDKVISNMDIYYTYKRLLKDQKAPEKSLNQPKSSSAIVFYWGVKGTHPSIDVHNTFFSNNEKMEYEEIFENNTVTDDPSVYICNTSKLVKTDAPEGHENWMVLVCCPHDSGQYWDKLAEFTKKNAIRKLNKVLGIDLEELIVSETILTPKYLDEHHSAAFGAIYGNSSNNRFSAFQRHSNFSGSIKDLYFAGGSVHPGAGVPMCLNSAKIVGKLIS